MYRSGRDLVLELEGGNPSTPDKMHTSGRIGLEFIHLKAGRSDSGSDSPPQACLSDSQKGCKGPALLVG
jgi:hypothetical protein